MLTCHGFIRYRRVFSGCWVIFESRNKDGLSRLLVFYIVVCTDKVKFVLFRIQLFIPGMNMPLH